jgi:hypothetical protein
MPAAERHAKCKRASRDETKLEQGGPGYEPTKAGKLVLNRLKELKGIEVGLNKQFAGLRFASSKARVSFLQKLADLEERTLWLEGLMDALDAGAEQGSPQMELA